MPSISRINAQLEKIAEVIDTLTTKALVYRGEEAERIAATLGHYARVQKALLESQVLLFIEATESDLDMPVLPLFVEDRGSDPEGEPEEEDGEPFNGGFIGRRGNLVLYPPGDGEPESEEAEPEPDGEPGTFPGKLDSD